MSLNGIPIAAASITQMTDTRVSDKDRYYRNRSRGYKKPFWMISLTTPPLEYKQGVGLAAYLDSLEGSLEVINVPNPFPAIKSQSGLAALGTNNAGLSTVVIDGFASNEVEAVVAGDFISFANHPKVYRITQTKDASFSGTVTVNITPALYELVTDNTAVSYGSQVNFQVALNESVSMEISSSNNKNIVFDLELVEQG